MLPKNCRHSASCSSDQKRSLGPSEPTKQPGANGHLGMPIRYYIDPDRVRSTRGVGMTWLSVLDVIGASPDAPGIDLEAGLHGPAEHISPKRLLNLAGLAAEAFRAVGLERGDRIVTLLPSGRPLLQAIFGAWHAGGVICIMASVIESRRSSFGLERLNAMLGIVRPKIIIAAGSDFAALGPIAAVLNARLLMPTDLPSEGAVQVHAPLRNKLDDMAFIQFTSGSTGLPKAIVIEHGQLANHVEVICRNARFTPSDVMVSWLPLHHDMGFVGGLLTPLFARCALALIPVERFVRDPGIWLSTISKRRGTLSPAPSFAYRILSNPFIANHSREINLECWRFAWIGAEPVSLSVIDEFERIYGASGLRRGTLHPSYGMAEATLGIAIRKCGADRRTICISRPILQRHGKVSPVEPSSSEAMPLVSNGPPLEGMQISIRDKNEADVPDGTEGRIFVKGYDIVRRYFGSDEDPQPNGWLDTGDLGIVIDGEVYVTGRAKDVIIRDGVNVHASLVEEAVVRGMPDLTQRAVAFAVPHDEDLRDEVIVCVEVRRAPPSDEFAAAVRHIVNRDVGIKIDRVHALPRGAIPRTTSGKIQRSRARTLFLGGKLTDSGA
jgi:fatty-acyl-CoA synthase